LFDETNIQNLFDSEANRLSALQSYRSLRMSIDAGRSRLPMNTIVELSPEQAQTSTEDLPRMSLTPLAQGNYISFFIYVL